MKITIKNFIRIVTDCSGCCDYCGYDFHNVHFTATEDPTLSDSKNVYFKIIATSPLTHITHTFTRYFPRHKLLGLFGTKAILMDYVFTDPEYAISKYLYKLFLDYILAIRLLESQNEALKQKINCRQDYDFIYLDTFTKSTGRATYKLQTDLKRLHLLLLAARPENTTTQKDTTRWNAYIDYVYSTAIDYHKKIAKTTNTQLHPFTENTIVEVPTYQTFNDTIYITDYKSSLEEERLSTEANKKGLNNILTELNNKLNSTTSPTT